MKKVIMEVLVVIVLLSVSGCGSHSLIPKPFSGVAKEDIPEILNITVGTRVNTSFTSGITDNPDYQAVWITTYADTTEEDYEKLLKHYQTTAIQPGISHESTNNEITSNEILNDKEINSEAGNSKLQSSEFLYDWGRLLMNAENGSITITAFIE